MSPLQKTESGSSMMAGVAVLLGLFVLGFVFLSSGTAVSSTSFVSASAPLASSTSPSKEEQIDAQHEALQQQLSQLYPSVRRSSDGSGDENRFSQESRYEIKGEDEQTIILYIDLDYAQQDLDIEVNMEPMWNPGLKALIHTWLQEWQEQASENAVTLTHNLISE